MDEVLSLSDLAGLSRRSGRNLKRQHSSSSPCPREESNKQHVCAVIQRIHLHANSTMTESSIAVSYLFRRVHIYERRS